MNKILKTLYKVSERLYRASLIRSIYIALADTENGVDMDISDLEYTDHINHVDKNGSYYIYTSSECSDKAFEEPETLISMETRHLEELHSLLTYSGSK